MIYGGRIIGAKIRAEHARQRAAEAAYDADRAAAELWSIQMEAFSGPAQPSPTIGQCLSGGYGWIEVKCHRCGTQASIPLDAIRRPRDTPIWKLEAALTCRSCGTRRYKPPVHMVKLTERREITPYRWTRPDDTNKISCYRLTSRDAINAELLESKACCKERSNGTTGDV